MTERLATRALDAPPARAATAAGSRALRRAPARRQPRGRAPPQPATPQRRGSFSRFLALLFLFVLIAAIVAGVVILNSDSQQSQKFERVARDTVNEQVDGLRNLIDDAQ